MPGMSKTSAPTSWPARRSGGCGKHALSLEFPRSADPGLALGPGRGDRPHQSLRRSPGPCALRHFQLRGLSLARFRQWVGSSKERIGVKVEAMVIVPLVLAAAIIGTGFWLYTPDRPRAALEAKYLASPGDYLDVAGLRLHLRDSGPKEAPAVIMLHGFGASVHTWEPWARGLSSDHRVICFDLPGFGLTGADPSGDYTDERTVQVLGPLMDRLGLPRASLVGNSIGGKIAWNFAACHPDRVDRLVLISPDGFASPGFEYGKKAE